MNLAQIRVDILTVSHRKLVLTGGPCAGKSTIAELLGKAFPDKVVVVPESASMLYRGGFPRWPEPASIKRFQTAVYQVQKQHELTYGEHYITGLLVLDRGTIDGAAYWPDGPEAFFGALESTIESELTRYDAVIYLESADFHNYELHRTKNATRTEAWEDARSLDQRTRQLWAKHPNVAFIQCQQSFVDKVAAVIKVVEQELRQVSLLSTKTP